MLSAAGFLFWFYSKALGSLVIVAIIYLFLISEFTNYKLYFDISMSILCAVGGLCFIFIPYLAKFSQPISDVTLLYLGGFMALIAT